MMTPRQIERAVNASLSRLLPPMVQQLRDDLVTALREEFAARGEAPAVVQQLSLLPEDEAALRDAIAQQAPASPWVVGIGAGRRLTEAGLAHLQSLQAAGKPAADIAAEMGITRRAVDLRSATGAPAAARAHSRMARPTDMVEQAKSFFIAGKGTAEIARLLDVPKTTVHGWKDRGGWVRGKRPPTDAPAEAEPVVVGVDLGSKPSVQVDVPVVVAEAQTVAVVPAAEVPAPRIPPQPSTWGSVSRVPEVAARVAPPPPPPKPKVEPQVITTTPKEVRAWLIAAMKAGGLSLVQAQDRVGFMTHDQALAEANQRRARAGHPPFAFIGARSAA